MIQTLTVILRQAVRGQSEKSRKLTISEPNLSMFSVLESYYIYHYFINKSVKSIHKTRTWPIYQNQSDMIQTRVNNLQKHYNKHLNREQKEKNNKRLKGTVHTK